MAVLLTKPGIDAALAKSRNGDRIELADSKEAGLRLRAGERDAKWSVLVRTPVGGRIRIPLGAWPGLGISDARKAAQDAKREVEQGVNPNENRRAARHYTKLSELIDTYDKMKLANLRRGAATKRALEGALKRFLDRDPATLTRRDIAGAIDKIAERAPVSANRSLAYVKAFFGWAVGRGHLPTNPADGISKPTPEVARDRTPSLDELVEIWNAAGTLGYPFGPAVRLLIATAMRREEIAAMGVAELNLADATNAVFTLPAERSKNGRAIRVPLSSLALTALLPALAARPVIDDKSTLASLVFTTTGETAASGWSKAKSRLDRTIASKRAEQAAGTGRGGEAMLPWRLHDLRRSFATVACDVLHIDPAVADRCLNHVGASTTSTISRVYGRSEMLDQRKSALEAWGKLLTGLIEPAGSNVVSLVAAQAA